VTAELTMAINSVLVTKTGSILISGPIQNPGLCSASKVTTEFNACSIKQEFCNKKTLMEISINCGKASVLA
jgi:hypothetical protein